MERIEGRVAVVLGGAGGVGRGVAGALVEAGASVAVADLRLDAARSVADDLAEAGGDSMALSVDATDRASLAECYAAVVDRFGRLEILSNQTGIVSDASVARASEQDWAWFWEFNVMAQVRAVDEALGHLRQAPDGGHVVLTSSMAGLVALDPALTGSVNTGLYTTTKHALVGYGQMLRADLAADGIGVTVVVPGLVEGDLGRTSAEQRPDRFGGPDAQQEGSMPPGAMDPLTAGRRVVAAVRADMTFGFTHPELVELAAGVGETMRADAAAVADG